MPSDDDDTKRKLDVLAAEQVSEDIRVATDRLRESFFELLQQIRTPVAKPSIDLERNPSVRH
jgi:16S rRNA G966 N2-methylase RsmD